MRIKKKYLQEKTDTSEKARKAIEDMVDTVEDELSVDEPEAKEFVKNYVIGSDVSESEDLNEVVSGEHVVEYHSERSGEEPFYMNGIKWQFVNGIYPNGRRDIAVYRFDHDLAYDYMWFMKEVVPKPINEVGPGKVHTKKFDRCVKDVKKNSPDVDNPYAICQASLGAKAIKKSHQRKEDYTNESNFTMTKGELIESLNIKRGRKVIKTIKVKNIKND
jgi:hypothetical protein